jgi:phenylacetate-CoA ligase
MIQQLLAEKYNKLSSTEDVLKKSDGRLKQLLKYVLTHSVFYKKHYAEQGITLKDSDHLKIEDLPFTTKDLLMKNFDEVSNDPLLNIRDIGRYVKNNNDYRLWYKNKYKIIKTSGCSGRYGVFIYDKQSWNILRAFFIDRASYIKVNPFKKNRLAIIVDTNGLHAGISLMGNIPKMFYDLLILNVHESQKTITDKLNSFQPDILTGYANSIYLCAHEQIDCRLHIQPKQVGCSGEPLTHEAINIIHKAFRIPPTNLYAASESICMAYSSPKCQNLHIVYDWNLIEVIDESGKKTQEETIGNAVLTNLYNYSFPLIRYKMNDRISVQLSSCPDCGSIFPAITKMEGRAEDMLKFTRRDGSEENVSPSFMTFFNDPNIRSFRVIQKERNYLEIQLVLADKNPADATINKLDDNFKSLFSIKNLSRDVSYKFVFVDTISADATTGKITCIITFEKYQKQLSKNLVPQEVFEGY